MDPKHTIKFGTVFLIAVGVLVGAAWVHILNGDSGESDIPDFDIRDTADRWGYVSIYPGEVNQTNSSVEMTIRVGFEIVDRSSPPLYDDLRYYEPMLCLYDADGDVLHAELLGTVETRKKQLFTPSEGANTTYWTYQNTTTVDTSVSTIPQYIVVDHPRLRNQGQFVVQSRIWNPDQNGYAVSRNHLGEIQDRFEYPRTNETGVCG